MLIRLIKKDSNGNYLLKREKMDFIIKEISDKKEKEKISRQAVFSLFARKRSSWIYGIK